MKALKTSILLFVCLLAGSCSNDEPKLPDNAISVNIMKEGFGGTTIGQSDVYINVYDNFVSEQCGITDLGSKSNLITNPNLGLMAQDVAVEPGRYYQFFLLNNVKTVAGEWAISLQNAYYNVYVDSWIYQADEVAGAKITYAETYPQNDKLPEWDSTLEVILKDTDSGEVGSYTFDKSVAIDPDFTIVEAQNSLDKHIEITVKGNTISFFNAAYIVQGFVKLRLLLRQGSVYTRVLMIVNSPV